MKPADVHCQCGCGRVVLQPRGGGPRKRFFENACRARWTRKGKNKTAAPPKSPAAAEGHDDRQRTLLRIYAALEADIDARGAMVSGRVNPAVEMLRKIGIELDRRAPITEQDQADELESLIAV